MRLFPRLNYTAWLLFPILALTLSGCFQSANDSISPTSVNLTSIAPLRQTDTPFITPISTGGFALPTDDPNRFLTSTPTEGQVIPAVPPTETQNVFVPTQGQPEAPTQEPPTAAPQISAPTQPANPVLLATPTALPSEGPCVHTVQPGEWFYSIARKYNITPDKLVAANPRFAGNPDSLQPGDVLNIPNCNQQPAAPTAAPNGPTATPTPPSLLPTNPNAPTPIQLSGREYTVVQGDTLGSIARKFNTTVQALKDANGMGTNDFIRVGQVLQIPAP